MQSQEHNQNSKDKISPLEPSYPTIIVPEYSNINEAQEKKTLKPNKKTIKVLKEEISKSLYESQKTQIVREHQ